MSCKTKTPDESVDDSFDVLLNRSKKDTGKKPETLEMEFDLLMGKKVEKPAVERKRLKTNIELPSTELPISNETFLGHVNKSYDGKYHCPKCTNIYNGRNGLNEHYKIVHINMLNISDEQVNATLNKMTIKRDSEYFCSSCKMKYNYRGSVHRHILVHHPNELRGIKKDTAENGYDFWKKYDNSPKRKNKLFRRKNKFDHRVILTDYDY